MHPHFVVVISLIKFSVKYLNAGVLFLKGGVFVWDNGFVHVQVAHAF
jgi:hypothetical protein